MGSVEWDQSVLIGEGLVNEVWRIGYGGGWTELWTCELWDYAHQKTMHFVSCLRWGATPCTLELKLGGGGGDGDGAGDGGVVSNGTVK